MKSNKGILEFNGPSGTINFKNLSDFIKEIPVEMVYRENNFVGVNNQTVQKTYEFKQPNFLENSFFEALKEIKVLDYSTVNLSFEEMLNDAVIECLYEFGHPDSVVYIGYNTLLVSQTGVDCPFKVFKRVMPIIPKHFRPYSPFDPTHYEEHIVGAVHPQKSVIVRY